MKKFLFRLEDSVIRKYSLMAVFTIMIMGLSSMSFAQSTSFKPTALNGASSADIEVLKNYDFNTDRSAVLQILREQLESLELQAQTSETGIVSLKAYFTGSVLRKLSKNNNVDIMSSLSKSYDQLIVHSLDYSGLYNLQVMLTDLADLLD